MRESRKSHGSQTRLQYILQGALTRDNKEGIGKNCTCFYCSAFFFCLIGSGDKEGDLWEAGRAKEGMRERGGEGAAIAVPKPAASSLPFCFCPG